MWIWVSPLRYANLMFDCYISNSKITFMMRIKMDLSTFFCNFLMSSGLSAAVFLKELVFLVTSTLWEEFFFFFFFAHLLKGQIFSLKI